MKKIIIGVLILTISLFANDEMLYTKGQMIFNEHGCFSCHGSNAEGSSDYPRLAGRSKKYLIQKLKGYREGTIHSKRAHIMHRYAKKLSDKDIEALAEFLSKKIYTNEQPDDQYYEEFFFGNTSF